MFWVRLARPKVRGFRPRRVGSPVQRGKFLPTLARLISLLCAVLAALEMCV